MGTQGHYDFHQGDFFGAHALATAPWEGNDELMPVKKNICQ
jgi:hypothetical protein